MPAASGEICGPERSAERPLVDQVTIVGLRKEVQGYRFNVVTFPILYDVSLEK